MTITFITGNKKKLEEAKMLLEGYDVDNHEFDLDEIQGEPRKILEDKAKRAYDMLKKPLFVEDVNLCFDSLNGLPGPYIKSFLKNNSLDELYSIASFKGESKAVAKCFIGYIDENEKFHFFEAGVGGKIVEPRGQTDFGWDAIFLPDGKDLTYGEMTKEEKNEISHRRLVFEKFKAFLDKK